jgi:GntR family transcriptional regulator/MocR family aminotransferase
VVPPDLLAGVRDEKLLADQGSPRIEQYALADFLRRGELDRHLRKMRAQYRARRDLLIEALADALPEASVRGIAAGLHVTVELGEGDERAIAREASRRGLMFNTMSDYRDGAGSGRPVLMLGYGRMRENSIRDGIMAVAEAVRAARSR